MKVLQKISKLLSDWTAVFIILIAVVTFLVPKFMAWVNNMLFFDPVGNKFTVQSVILGVIMLSMGMTLSNQDFKNLAKRPWEIFVGAVAQYFVMPFLAFALVHLLRLPDALALGLILVGCCPGGVSSNIMSYLCHGDVALSVGMTTVSTLLSPLMTPLLVSWLANGIRIHIGFLPMFVNIIETVILPIFIGYLLNTFLNKYKGYQEFKKIMPGVAVIGLACVVGGVTASQGSGFFTSGAMIFLAVFLHNFLGYCLGYLVGIISRFNVPKKRTISIEVGMQNAGLATNLATTSVQFAAVPQSAIICAVSCVWHSISGTLIAAFFAWLDKRAEKEGKTAKI